MVGVIDALGPTDVVIVGHDWGAPVAWHAALLRPDRFRAVVGLSVPFRPRGSTRPTSAMPQTEQSWFYQLYFQKPGVAEAEFEGEVRTALRRLLYSGSGDSPRRADIGLGHEAPGMIPRTGGFLTRTIDPERLPPWLTEEDIDLYAGEFAGSGFGGGLNWYRNIDRNWELTAPFAGLRVTVPALHVAGDYDLVVAFPGADKLIANLATFVPRTPGRGQRRPPRIPARPAMIHGLPTRTTRKVSIRPSGSRTDTYSPTLKAWSPKR
jgi:pimeloyl-ACP methyl ester carboxylesterase